MQVACPHFSGFKECYASSTGGFRCFKGPSGSSLACATQSGTTSGALWTATEGFQSPDLPEDDAVDKDTDAHAAAPKAESAAAAKAEKDTSNKSAFKKVATEAGPAPAKPAHAAVPTAVPSLMVENGKQITCPRCGMDFGLLYATPAAECTCCCIAVCRNMQRQDRQHTRQ